MHVTQCTYRKEKGFAPVFLVRSVANCATSLVQTLHAVSGLGLIIQKHGPKSCRKYCMLPVPGDHWVTDTCALYKKPQLLLLLKHSSAYPVKNKQWALMSTTLMIQPTGCDKLLYKNPVLLYWQPMNTCGYLLISPVSRLKSNASIILVRESM